MDTMDRPAIDPDEVTPPEGGFGKGDEPRQTGRGLVVDFQHGVITAQKVAVARSPEKVILAIKQHAAIMGEAYYYSWKVNDKRHNRQTVVEGLTIKGADDLARLYGNCIVDVRVEEFETHYVFHGRFTDLETGYSLTRPFRQRRRQDIGMKDSDRAADIVFQIGASKAQRNVINHALQTYSDRMVDEAKKGLLGWITANKEKAAEYIDKMMLAYDIDVKRIEVTVATPRAQWVARDVAAVMSTLRSIEEGMIHPNDAFPIGEAVTLVEQENAEREAANKARDPKSETPHDADGVVTEPEKPKRQRKAAGDKAPPPSPPPPTTDQGQADAGSPKQEGPAGPTPPAADEGGKPVETKPASPPPPSAPPPAAGNNNAGDELDWLNQ